MTRHSDVIGRGVVAILQDDEPVGIGFLASLSGRVITSRETLVRAGATKRYRLRFADGRIVVADEDESVALSGGDATVAVLTAQDLPTDVSVKPLALGFERIPPVEDITVCELALNTGIAAFLSGEYVATDPAPDPSAPTYRMRLRVDSISEGCLGSPVWDAETRTVIGVVVAVNVERRTAQAVPVARVVAECPALSFASRNPYVGLAPYNDANAHLFFGRDDIVAELVERLRTSSRWITVVGPAGSGKSSLLRAGLLPRLRNGEIAGLPNPVAYDAMAMTSFRSIERESDSTTVILVDPLEEALDALPDDNARRDWIQRLDALADEPRTVVLMSVTSGFLPVVAALSSEIANRRIFPSAYQMPVSIREYAVREIIETPLKQPGYECLIPDSLTDALLDGLHEAEADDNAGRTVEATQLPRLQLTLWLMWRLQNRRGAYALSYDDYQAVGPVSEALNRWADDILQGLNPFDEDIARRVLSDELVARDAAGKQPPRCRWRYLAELPLNNDERPAVERVVAALESEGLLRSDGVGDAKRVRLAHDVLVTQWDQLRMWLENAEYTLWLRRVRRTSVAEPLWRQTFRAIRAPIIRGLRRAFEKRYATTAETPVTTPPRARWRLVTGLVAVLVIVAVVLMVRGVRPSRVRPTTDAARSAILSGAERLALRDPAGLVDLANVYLDSSRDKNLQRAVATVWSAWYSQWDEGLVTTIPSPASAVALSPNGAYLATTNGDGGIWDIETGQRTATAQSAVFISEDGKKVAFVAEGRLHLRDFNSAKPIRDGIPFDGVPSSVAFSVDGERVAAASGNRLVVWEIGASNPMATVENDAPLGKIRFAGSGDWLVAISGTPQTNETTTDLFVWNLTGKPARRSLNKADDFVVSPSGRFVAAIKNRRSTVEIFDTTTLVQSLDRVAEVRTNRVDDVRFSPDEATLVTQSYSSERVWDRATGERIGERVRTVLFPAGDARSLVLSENGTLTFRTRQLDGKTTDTAIVLSSEEAFIKATLASDPAWAVAASERAVAFVNLQTGRVTATVAGYVEGDVRDGIGYITDRQVTNLIDPTTGEAKPGTVSGELVAVGRNGRIVTANREDSVTVWAAGKDTNARKSPLVATPAGAIPLALAPDGTTALALTPDSSVQAFDARSGKPLGAPYRLDATTEPLTVRYSPDGRFVAFGASDFALVDLKDARKVASGTCFSGSFAFADNGTAFVVLKDATTVQIRRLDKADDVRTFTLTNPLPTTSRGSFDSALRRMIYSTANGGAVTVAEFTDGVAKERSVVLSGTLAGSAAFDGKGTRLALPYASGKSAFVHVLELRRDRTTTFEFAQNATPQDICVAFDRDGERLVASSPSVERSGRTTCWDARSGAMLWSTPVGGTRIQYNTSETRLAVGGVVLDARTGFPFPVRSSVARTTNASDAPTVALLSDESYVALTDGGVVTVSVSTSKWTPTDVVERTAAVTGIQPTGSSSEPVRLDPQALAELRRRLRTER